MTFIPKLENIPKERLLLMLYGSAGSGKTTSALSVLKNPNLKVIHFALESTTTAAVRNCFNVYDINELKEGQYTLVIPEPSKAKDEATFKSNLDGTFFDNIVKQLFITSGVDVATGNSVKLGAFNTYDQNTVLIFDGISALIETITNRANSDAINKKVNDNVMAVYSIGQKYIVGLFNQLTKGTKAHIIAIGHQKLADDKAIQKYGNIKPINPDVYTRSLVDQVCGMFTYVMYAKRDSLSGRYSLSVAESQCYTRDSIDRVSFATVAKNYNANIKSHEKN